MQALLSLDHFPAGMELFPASDEDQWALIKGVIDDSDYYILVIGGRYGSTTEDGISYTEMEFEYAKKSGKPILAFVHQHPELLPSGKTDLNDGARTRLQAFKKRVETGRHVKFWTNADDLKAKVIQSISAETKRNPQEGWVRFGRVADPALLEALRSQIDALKMDLATAKSEAPAGSEAYAGGADEFEVAVYYQVYENGKGWSSGSRNVTVTWNTIFFEVGPTLMEEASESQMKGRLSGELWRYEYDDFPAKVSNTSISDDSFDTIKIQLLALGLIQKSPKKHVPSDTNRYWSLTSYGETALMKLRAIPKSEGAVLRAKTDTATESRAPDAIGEGEQLNEAQV